MSSIDLENLKQALVSEETVVFVYLFGSHVTGEVTPLSDVDIAVYPRRKLSLDDRLAIIYRLNKKTRLDNLDISFLDSLENLYLLAGIIGKGILLLDRDKERRELFEVMTHHRFLDFQYQRKLYMGCNGAGCISARRLLI
jgi:predicted nucleotidyltransferase